MKKVKFLRLKFNLTNMYTAEERKRYSDHLRKHGITEQKDIDGVLDFIYTIASVAVDIAEKENKHPE